MPKPLFDKLPTEHSRLIKMASVPIYIRAIFSHLPERLLVTAILPINADDMPLSVRQLLKIAHVAEFLTVTELEIGNNSTFKLELRRNEEVFAPDKAELENDISELTNNILERLFYKKDFTNLLEVFAFQSATLSTLRSITNNMLQSTDIDKAKYIMLSGITSGYSLGFNRAAFFKYDESGGVFTGEKAIGPKDENEAHRIWEEIEYLDKNIDSLIVDYAHRNFDTRFQQFIQTISLKATDKKGDEIKKALKSKYPLLFNHKTPVNESLAELGLSGEYVVAAIKPHGKTLGLLVADNFFSVLDVTGEQMCYLSFFIDQTALVWENLELLKSVEELAQYDGLTNLFNRREFETRFDDEQARANRSGRSCSLLIFDIDYFKKINDTKGHEAGDETLRAFSRLLQEYFRSHDIIGRYGGDEFVVFMPDSSKEQMITAGKRLGRAAMNSGLSISAGGANWPEDTDETLSLLAVADANLYNAKNAGRGLAAFTGEGAVSYFFESSKDEMFIK